MTTYININPDTYCMSHTYAHTYVYRLSSVDILLRWHYYQNGHDRYVLHASLRIGTHLSLSRIRPLNGEDSAESKRVLFRGRGFLSIRTHITHIRVLPTAHTHMHYYVTVI